MKMSHRIGLCLSLATGLLLSLGAPRLRAAEEDGRTIELGKFTLTAPEAWTKQRPRAPGIVAYEFSAPASEGDEQGGRITVGQMGGAIEANITRWLGQFAQAGGDEAPIEERTVAGQKVHVIDVSGTFRDQMGPMTPGVDRENYRMLAAVIELKGGNHFVKFTGPRQTVADQEAAFEEFIESLAQR